MTGTCWVTTTNGAFLEMSLQNITSGEGIAAQNTHIWSVSSVSEKMTLQMLSMKVCLCAVRAGKFSIGVFGWNQRVLTSASRGYRGSTWSTWQDTSPTLRSNYVSRRLHILHHSHTILAVALHPTLHVLKSMWRHGSQRLIGAVLQWSWSDWLWVGHRH